MQNLIRLLAGFAGALIVVAAVNRFRDPEWRASDLLVKRAWSAFAHPKRRGLPDPTWPQVWTALTAFGAFLIALASGIAPSGASPNPAIWIPGVVLAGVGVIGIIGCAAVALLRRRDDKITPFELLHGLRDPECEEIFQANPFRNWFGQQLRVGVRNISSQGVQRVRIFMRIEAGDGRSYYLHLQHDNDRARQASRNGESLTISQTSYFDVALIKEETAVVGVKWFWFYYADADVSELSRLQLFGPIDWRIRLEVSGWTDFRDVVGLSKDFRLAIDQNLTMTLAEV